MAKNKIFMLLLAIAATATGCNRTLYTPEAVDAYKFLDLNFSQANTLCGTLWGLSALFALTSIPWWSNKPSKAEIEHGWDFGSCSTGWRIFPVLFWITLVVAIIITASHGVSVSGLPPIK